MSTSGARSNSADKRESRTLPSRSRLIRVNPPSTINLFLLPPLSPPPIVPPPPWGRRARTTSNIRLATQLYCEGPTNWREGGETVDGGAGERGFEGQTRTRVRSHRVARQTTDRRDDNIRDRGVKLCPGKRDNRSLRNCPPKSPSSSSPIPRRHDFTIRRRRARWSDCNKSLPVARVRFARFADLHTKAPSLFAGIILRRRRKTKQK